MAFLLLLDHPCGTTETLCAALEEEGHRVTWIHGSGELSQLIASEHPALVLAALDLVPPRFGRDLAALQDAPPLILLEDFGAARDDSEELYAVAFETLQRPIPTEQIVRASLRALESRELRLENQRLREEIGERFQLGGLVSSDPHMREVFDTVRSVADSRASLLITGESGTGKTVLARCVHELSGRATRPFVVVNCGALPGALLESELFGHTRGAFTGAVRDRIGKFEAADGGTIFLDEVGTASHELQVKLLRVIEEGRFERVGETETREVDVRTIAATNVDLLRAVGDDQFRADLYYRLNVVGVEIPPLRERLGDVPILAERFLARIRATHDRPAVAFEAAAMAALCEHAWPGNVRELENTLERAVLLSRGDHITESDLWPEAHRRALKFPPSQSESVGPGPSAPWGEMPVGPLRKALEVPERWLILRALQLHAGQRQRTALALGINRTTLFNKMRKYHLDDFPINMGPADDTTSTPDTLDRAS